MRSKLDEAKAKVKAKAGAKDKALINIPESRSAGLIEGKVDANVNIDVVSKANIRASKSRAEQLSEKFEHFAKALHSDFRGISKKDSKNKSSRKHLGNSIGFSKDKHKDLGMHKHIEFSKNKHNDNSKHIGTRNAKIGSRYDEKILGKYVNSTNVQSRSMHTDMGTDKYVNNSNDKSGENGNSKLTKILKEYTDHKQEKHDGNGNNRSRGNNSYKGSGKHVDFHKNKHIDNSKSTYVNDNNDKPRGKYYNKGSDKSVGTSENTYASTSNFKPRWKNYNKGLDKPVDNSEHTYANTSNHKPRWKDYSKAFNKHANTSNYKPRGKYANKGPGKHVDNNKDMYANTSNAKPIGRHFDEKLGRYVGEYIDFSKNKNYSKGKYPRKGRKKHASKWKKPSAWRLKFKFNRRDLYTGELLRKNSLRRKYLYLYGKRRYKGKYYFSRPRFRNLFIRQNPSGSVKPLGLPSFIFEDESYLNNISIFKSQDSLYYLSKYKGPSLNVLRFYLSICLAKSYILLEHITKLFSAYQWKYSLSAVNSYRKPIFVVPSKGESRTFADRFVDKYLDQGGPAYEYRPMQDPTKDSSTGDQDSTKDGLTEDLKLLSKKTLQQDGGIPRDITLNLLNSFIDHPLKELLVRRRRRRRKVKVEQIEEKEKIIDADFYEVGYHLPAPDQSSDFNTEFPKVHEALGVMQAASKKSKGRDSLVLKLEAPKIKKPQAFIDNGKSLSKIIENFGNSYNPSEHKPRLTFREIVASSIGKNTKAKPELTRTELLASWISEARSLKCKPTKLIINEILTRLKNEYKNVMPKDPSAMPKRGAQTLQTPENRPKRISKSISKVKKYKKKGFKGSVSSRGMLSKMKGKFLSSFMYYSDMVAVKGKAVDKTIAKENQHKKGKKGKKSWSNRVNGKWRRYVQNLVRKDVKKEVKKSLRNGKGKGKGIDKKEEKRMVEAILPHRYQGMSSPLAKNEVKYVTLFHLLIRNIYRKRFMFYIKLLFKHVLAIANNAIRANVFYKRLHLGSVSRTCTYGYKKKLKKGDRYIKNSYRSVHPAERTKVFLYK